MKKLLPIFVILLALVVPSVTQAEEGLYLGGQGGVNFLHSNRLRSLHCSFDTGYNVGIVGGYEWCNGWILEGEITYRSNHYNLHGRDEDDNSATFHGKVRTWSFMVNGYYDIPLPIFWCNVTPYIGSGIGSDCVYQKIRIDGEYFRDNHSDFAWQVMAGINYAVCDSFVLSAEYKYHVSPLQHGHHLQNQSITIGIKKFFFCCY